MGASKYISRSYSTAEPHPADPASTASVPILESLTAPVNPASITQESMLLKLEDLVSLPNTFAVVKIGGHQVRLNITFLYSRLFRNFELLLEGQNGTWK